MNHLSNFLTVNKDKCAKDDFCVAECPMAIITTKTEDGYPVMVKGGEQMCIACGHCVAVCPFGALDISECAADKCLPVNKELDLTPERAEYFLRRRRSTRQFKPDPVPRDDLQKLIEVARYGNTGHNSQGVQWTVLTQREQVEKICSVVADWLRVMIEKAPDMAAMIAAPRIVQAWDYGIDVIARGAPQLIITHAHADDAMTPNSCVIALAYLELYAASMGIGTCWAGFINSCAKFFPPMAGALALPEGHVMLGGVMVGYNKARYFRSPQRREPRITWR